MKIWHSILVTLFVFVSAAQAQELVPFENQYSARLYGFTVTATSRLSLQQNGIYELVFDVEALIGRVTETSHVEWSAKDQQVIPLDYHYKRSGLGKNRDDALKIDWLKQSVVYPKDQSSWQFNATQKIQDNLSYQLQLRQDLINGKKTLVYPLIDKKAIKDYKFEIVGEEELETPLGKVKTLKVKRAQTNDNRETFAWFAKDFQYMLVRLQQEENGSAYTIYISKASINGKAIDHF